MPNYLPNVVQITDVLEDSAQEHRLDVPIGVSSECSLTDLDNVAEKGACSSVPTHEDYFAVVQNLFKFIQGVTNVGCWCGGSSCLTDTLVTMESEHARPCN